MVWLRGQHKNRKVAVDFYFLQALHHLEPIHTGHLQVEHDQVVAVPEMEFADLGGRGRGCDAGIAGTTQ